MFTGIKKGFSSFVWMAKIVIPISLLVTLFQWTGWLSRLDFVLNPLTSFINLPPEAALTIFTGMFINIYAVIAVIAVIPFTVEQMTLIAIFTLIAHSLLIESVIQHKSGMHATKIILIRIAAAVLTVFIVSQFFDNTSQGAIVPASFTTQIPFLEVLKSWALSTMGLMMKIFGIIMGIMIVLGCLNSLGWVKYLIRAFKPLMRIIGLPERTAMMFVTAVIFGLFYGGAVIVEEAKKGNLTGEELERLHIAIGINHAMVEDPILFAALGINAFWLVVPRFIMAIIAVQTYRAVNGIKDRLFR